MKTIIAWWSGGITSAVTCKICIDLYGSMNEVRVIFIDTGNEDKDTYRFKEDCERWYNQEIETITGLGEKYPDIQSVWRRFKSLNVANGAICSSTLKRQVREKWEKENKFDHQAFGFDISETNRAKALKANHGQTNPVFPLLMGAYTKKECIEMIQAEGIEVPRTYQYGFHNNNCFKTGCVQGGIGYWQKMQRDFPEKFDKMAEMEHELTNLRGEPVTMLKDQSNKAKASGSTLVFLKPHPDYPNVKDISQMKGREPKPLMECNGFCGTNDFSERNDTEDEINFSNQLDLWK